MSHEKLALLIDAENISHKYIKRILKELESIGTITYKRIYRDWTNVSAGGWKDVVLENGLFPIQQYSYTSGKNATDFAIIIDAMDILYEGSVDTFCLATSDSDFTRLAMRLREAGKRVIGLGEKKTPISFVVSCEKYIYLDEDQIKESVGREEAGRLNCEKFNHSFKAVTASKEGCEGKNYKKIKAPQISVVPTENEVETFVLNIVRENEKKKMSTNLNHLSQQLHTRYPGFRPQNYNCSQLKKLLLRFHSLNLSAINNEVFIKTEGKRENLKIEAVEREIVQIIRRNKEGKVSLGQLNQQLVGINKEYSYKRFGYSKFSKFVDEFNSIQLSKSPGGKDEVIVISN